jgi:hypothetical protein
MIQRCTALHCAEPVAGYSVYCEAHKRTLRRHGHPLQKAITLPELQPYLNSVTARRTKNPANPTWELLRGRWVALTGHAGASLEGNAAGAITTTYERQTAEQLVALGDSVAGDVVIDTALAMFSMWEQWPSRFKSDKAFIYQLSRRVRALSEVHTGSHWSAKDGRMKRTYRDVPPKTLECFGASLRVAFGLAGLRMAELDKKDAVGLVAERQELSDALKELK